MRGRASLVLALVGLAACSGGAISPDAGMCPGMAAVTPLVEGYCKSGEADRCYYDRAPMDGF